MGLYVRDGQMPGKKTHSQMADLYVHGEYPRFRRDRVWQHRRVDRAEQRRRCRDTVHAAHVGRDDDPWNRSDPLDVWPDRRRTGTGRPADRPPPTTHGGRETRDSQTELRQACPRGAWPSDDVARRPMSTMISLAEGQFSASSGP